MEKQVPFFTVGKVNWYRNSGVCVCVLAKSLWSCLTLCDHWTAACQAPLSMGFSKQDYQSGQPFIFLGNFPNPGIEPGSHALQTDSLPSKPAGIIIMPFSKKAVQKFLKNLKIDVSYDPEIPLLGINLEKTIT